MLDAFCDAILKMIEIFFSDAHMLDRFGIREMRRFGNQWNILQYICFSICLIFAFSKKKFYRGKNKCNVDAALCNHQQCFGVGMCIREEHGQFIKAKTVLHRGIPEAWGLWLQEDKLIIQLLS